METRLLIDGERVADDGAVLDVENPFTEATLASVATPSPEQLDGAVAAARRSALTKLAPKEGWYPCGPGTRDGSGA